jgi:RimJ/RimL family protein N-acetyltransferase
VSGNSPATEWLTEKPAESIREGDLLLTRTTRGDLDELVAAVNASLDELRPWFPWAQQPATEESVGTFLDQVGRSWEEGTGFSYVGRELRDGAPSGSVVCGCGLHVRVGPGALEIGYWVRSDCTRRGVATRAGRALTRAAFALAGVERLQIHCDRSNRPSACVAAKLGYVFDRTEPKEPAAPGETGRFMVWVRSAG